MDEMRNKKISMLKLAVVICCDDSTVDISLHDSMFSNSVHGVCIAAPWLEFTWPLFTLSLSFDHVATSTVDWIG